MTENPNADGSEPEVRTLDARALKALAHPLRVRIYDIVTQHGPQTASTLAEMTGESTGATSYHLRALARYDLLREAEGLGAGRERWWERPRGPVALTNPEAMKTPAGRAASQVVMTEFLERRHRQLMQYVTHTMAGGIPDPDTTLIATSTLSLTLAQRAELIGELQSVIDRFARQYAHQSDPSAEPTNIRADVFPLEKERP